VSEASVEEKESSGLRGREEWLSGNGEGVVREGWMEDLLPTKSVKEISRREGGLSG